jgi:hypothetical protein
MSILLLLALAFAAAVASAVVIVRWALSRTRPPRPGFPMDGGKPRASPTDPPRP